MEDHEPNVQTFNDLCHAKDQLKRIPIRKVARITLNSLRRQDSDLEVYEFVFCDAVRCFDPDEFETEVSAVLLPELVKHLGKITIELKDNALSCFLLDNLKSFLTFANTLLKFAEYVFQVSETYQLYKTATVFLEFLVHSYGAMRQTKTAVEIGTEEQGVCEQLFGICQKIQLIMLHLFAPAEKSSHYFQHLNVEEQFNCLRDVIIRFCKIGCLTMGIDNIRCMEAWKAVGKLCSMHEVAIQANETTWLHSLVLSINEEIERSFKSFLDGKQASRNDLVKLKLVSLLLRVLVKLLQLMKVNEFTGSSDILKTVIVIEDALLTKNLNKELTEGIRQHLVVGYMNSIGLLFKTSDFAKALTTLEYHSTEEIIAYFKVITYVIAKVIQEGNDVRVINLYTSEFNLLLTCINNLSRSHRIFSHSNDLYRKIVVHLSAFILTSVKHPSKKRQRLLEETLVGTILQDSYWVAVLGLDMWSVYLRYHPIQIACGYFKFWETINNNFSVFSSQPRAVYVRRMLHNIYTFLPTRMQQEAWQNYNVLGRDNYKLWIAIGLQTVDKRFTSKAMDPLVERLKANCKKLLDKASVDNLYETLHLLVLLSGTNDRRICEQIRDEVVLLWKSLKLGGSDLIKSDSIISTLVDVTVQVGKNMSFSAFCPVLEEIVQNSTMTNLSKQNMLKLLAMKPEANELLLKRLIKNGNPILKSIATSRLQTIDNSNIASLLDEIQKESCNDIPVSPNPAIIIPKTIDHRCYSNSKCALTQHINDKIDELFPGDDFDFDICSVVSDKEASPAAKRLKMTTDSQSTIDIFSPRDKREHSAAQIIADVKRQFGILQQMHDGGSLSSNQIGDIRRIGFAMSNLGS